MRACEPEEFQGVSDREDYVQLQIIDPPEK